MIDKDTLEAIGQMMDMKLEPVKVELAGVKADLVSVKADVASIKADMTNVKADLSSVKTDVVDLKADMSEVKIRTTRIEIKLENDITNRLHSLHEGHLLNSDKLDGIREVVDDLDSTVTALDVIHSIPSDKPLTIKIVK